MIRRTDDLERVVELERPAERIVSLVPSITETLFALGAGERVVGVTIYCVHPAEQVRTRTRVGGTKNIALKTIVELAPDLVIANVEENRRQQIAALEEAGLRVFVTFPRTIEGCLKMIADVAALAGADEPGKALIGAVEQARAEVASPARAAPARVLCPIWKNPYMTVNRDTFVDSVLRAAGGENVFADKAERYPRFTLDEVLERKPEVILLPTEPYHFGPADMSDFAALGARVPAVRDGRMYIVEGELLSWYGPRLPRALRTISALLG